MKEHKYQKMSENKRDSLNFEGIGNCPKRSSNRKRLFGYKHWTMFNEQRTIKVFSNGFLVFLPKSFFWKKKILTSQTDVHSTPFKSELIQKFIFCVHWFWWRATRPFVCRCQKPRIRRTAEIASMQAFPHFTNRVLICNAIALARSTTTDRIFKCTFLIRRFTTGKPR